MQNFIQKNKKILVIVFRVCIFLALITGVMYVLNFLSITSKKDTESVIRSICTSFYAYLVFVCASLVFSVVCFTTTSKVSSIVRTISLAITAIILFLNLSVINVFSEALKAVESESLKKAARVSNKIDKIASSETAAGNAVLSFATVLIIFILAITSIVALVKVLKSKDAPVDAA